ncbi:MFS transporter [Burkholderia singularis]|nr:MFS transporter [Burkholderia singularis]
MAEPTMPCIAARERARWRIAAWALFAVAYAIAFGQRVSPQTLVDVLRRDFATDGTGIGLLASGYFYGYMAMQVPTGILVDTLGVRRVMLISLAVSAASTLLFSQAPTLGVAFAARLCVACGDAIVFAALIKFVAQQFPERRFGFVSGVSQVSGYLGGIAATMPLAAGVAHWGWRPIYTALAGLIVVDALLIALVAPDARRARGGVSRAGALSMEIRDGIRISLAEMSAFLRTRDAWGSATSFVAYFVAAMSLSGVWGMPILSDGFGMAKRDAASAMSLVLVATVMGSVVGGFLVDRYARRLRRALSISSLVRALCLLPLAPSIGQAAGMATVIAGLVGFGFVGGATLPQIFMSLKRIYTSQHIGIGTAINSTFAGVVAASIQPLIGAIFDWSSAQAAQSPAAGYDWIVLTLVATSLPGIVAPYWMDKRRVDV